MWSGVRVAFFLSPCGYDQFWKANSLQFYAFIVFRAVSGHFTVVFGHGAVVEKLSKMG